MHENTKELVCDFVDHLMPELAPYESALYLLLLRMSFLRNESPQIRVGKRTLAEMLGKNRRRGTMVGFDQMTKVIKSLQEKCCITVGDTTREGTLYTILPPREIPLVKDRLASSAPPDNEDDYFNDPEKRLAIFERDQWVCQYCGERVTKDNVTLDHFVPQSKGGGHSKGNLRTCCLACNSIKAGKSFEEAAPLILKAIQERKQQLQKSITNR